MSKSVVITGSTRGIGRGLADNFLKLGAKVAVSGRTSADVKALVKGLRSEYGAENVTGAACDITDAKKLTGLWNAAVKAFGSVDVWINNAGISIDRKPLWDLPTDEVMKIVDINLGGALLSARQALIGMKEQGHGQVWLMEGFGSDGMTGAGMVSYGATKRGVNYLTKALRKDAKDTDVHICALSPGIVVTDLLMRDYDLSSEDWKKTKKIMNILADKVETVTPWLAENVLKSTKDGDRVAWLTRGKAFKRFVTAGFNKRDLFADIPGA